jgi:hypothetical protein
VLHTAELPRACSSQSHAYPLLPHGHMLEALFLTLHKQEGLTTAIERDAHFIPEVVSSATTSPVGRRPTKFFTSTDTSILYWWRLRRVSNTGASAPRVPVYWRHRYTGATGVRVQSASTAQKNAQIGRITTQQMARPCLQNKNVVDQAAQHPNPTAERSWSSSHVLF